MDLVQQQKHVEGESLKTWKLPVQIVSPLVSLVVLLLIVYALRQRVQYLRMLDRNDWKINFFDIDFVLSKKRRRDPNADEDACLSTETYAGRWNVHEVVIKQNQNKSTTSPPEIFPTRCTTN